jgi:hypothetical protein
LPFVGLGDEYGCDLPPRAGNGPVTVFRGNWIASLRSL